MQQPAMSFVSLPSFLGFAADGASSGERYDDSGDRRVRQRASDRSPCIVVDEDDSEGDSVADEDVLPLAQEAVLLHHVGNLRKNCDRWY